MNYYNHHIGDFDRATRHLTRIERSIYRDLLDVYYDTEQPLTLDLPALCRKIIARTNEEVTAVEQTLNEFFTKTPTGWYHARCEEELDAYRTSTSQKSIAGKASAAKRAEKRQRALDGIPTDVERPSNGTPTNQEPITNNQIETPLPPSGGIRASTRKMQTTLQGFIDDCKAKDERAFHGSTSKLFLILFTATRMQTQKLAEVLNALRLLLSHNNQQRDFQ